jgi:hypothetical protein
MAISSTDNPSLPLSSTAHFIDSARCQLIDRHIHWQVLAGIISCLIQGKVGGIQVLAGLAQSSQTVAVDENVCR